MLYIAATPKAHESRHRDYTIHRGRTVVRPAKVGKRPKVMDPRDLVVGRRADRVTLTQGDTTETFSRADALASTANFLAGHGWQRGAGYQPGQPSFAAIQGWNAATVYQQAIAYIGKAIDGQ